MSSAVLTAWNLEDSPRLQASIAGVLYLIVIVTGVFAIIYVRGAVFVPGDAAATAANILAHELRFRLGFVAELFACCCNIPMAVIFYNLFQVVNKSLTLVVVFFMLVGSAIESVVLLNHFTPLILLGDAHYLSALKPEQLQVQAYMSLALQDIGLAIALVFFGFYCLVLGYLIFRSTFLPRIIGVLLAIEGCGYLFTDIASFLAPASSSKILPYFLPTAIAEISHSLWLIVVGINVPRWEERASAARARSNREEI